jgi:transcription elongation factor GreA
MANEIYLTKEGRNKVLAELDALKKRKPLVQEEIARALEHGDLRENAEYHAAKETLTNISRRMMELESKLSRTRILDMDNLSREQVYIGVTVFLKDLDSGDEFDYTIVDTEEANFAEKKISVQSPMAQGLLGHKPGETVKVPLPNGVMEVKIIKIA